MDHLNSFPFTKTSCCFLLSLLAFSLQLLMLFETTLSFSFIRSHNSSSSNCLHHEKFALLQLKHGFLIVRGFYNSSSKLDSWNPAIDCCSWEGITCDEATGHVIGLDLSSNDESSSWIEGQIDSSLFSFHSLQKLNLSRNNFSPHPIPSGLGHLTNLTHLNLSYSHFTGKIPLEISRLTKLISLDFSYDRYQPALLKLKTPNLTSLIGNLSSLQELFLDNVNISGEHGGKWAQTVSVAMPDLQRLSLRYCGLQGPIDPSFFRILDLSQLSLDGNNLSIVLPDFFGDSSALTSLTLSDCGLYGEFPESIFLLSNLQNLDVSDNPHLTIHLPEFPHNSTLQYLKLDGTNIFEKLSDSIGNLKFLKELSAQNCNLSGSLPTSIANLTQLEHLDLSSNNFGGMVPSSISNLTQLEYLDLSSNNFGGMIPSSISNLTQLKFLLLSSNNFSGTIPSSIANLTELEYLILSSNNFSGTIPSSYLDKLKHIFQLALNYNSLEGSIPSSLFSHPTLGVLHLSHNQFSGYLPDSHNESSSMLEEINLDNNKLQGTIPRLVFELTNLQNLFLSNNNFSGTIALDMFKSFRNFSYLDLSDNSLSIINSNSSPHLIPSSQVLGLYLRSCNISEFPNILQNLSRLGSLDLSKNKIHGEIPTWIWEVGNGSLNYLNLSNNFLESFEHPLPQFSSSRLAIVDLHSNRLQGSLPILPHQVFFHDYSNNSFSSIIPATINFTSTQFFFLSGNNVSGEIPSSVCNARSLEILDLSNNNFSGNIPNCLGEIGNSLKILNLRKNSFQSFVPELFKKECNLRTLNLDSNQLEGAIPRSLANCKTLEVLDLGNNHLNDTFPFWLENLSNLRILILRSNKFHGPIAQSNTDQPMFPFLQIFDLSSNFFMGVVPQDFFLNWKVMIGEDGSSLSSNDNIVRYRLSSGAYYQDSVTITIKGLYREVVKILTELVYVDLSNNRFQGKIPDSIANLKLLRGLSFSQNDFIGPIPASLENLKVLESLDLSRNYLSGTIPLELTKLTFLEFLNLSQNLLHGSIPQSQQFPTFTNCSFLGNNDLCGPPLSRKCEDIGTAPQSTFISFGLDGDREIDWKFMWIGFGVGVGFGLGVVFWTLALWRKGSKKYFKLIDRMFVSIVHRYQ